MAQDDGPVQSQLSVVKVTLSIYLCMSTRLRSGHLEWIELICDTENGKLEFLSNVDPQTTTFRSIAMYVVIQYKRLNSDKLRPCNIPLVASRGASDSDEIAK